MFRKDDFMVVYHGSSSCIQKPDLLHSREDIDFGKGFYLTEDNVMASKWAANKTVAYVNKYEIDLSGLKVVELKLDKNWLDFVATNRGYAEYDFDIEDYDVIIGPTADDRLFSTLESYFTGNISAENAIKYLDIAGYSNQIALRSEKALEKLAYMEAKLLTADEKRYYKELAKKDRQEALCKMKQMTKKHSHKKVSFKEYER